MKKNQALMIESLGETILKNNKEFWTKAKEEMDRYVVAMSAVNNCYNFVTDAKAPETQVVEYNQLDLSIRVPMSVDIKALGF